MNNTHQIQMTVVYDNNLLVKELQKDWGFSCFIKGLEKSILFDTGTKGRILLSNMEALQISPDEVDLVFLSHEHKDHTSGLGTLLGHHPNIDVWLPEFFSSSFKEETKRNGATIIEVENFQQICEGAYTTGVIQGWIKEQSLILDTNKGLIIVTGCAHPRIVHIISTVKGLLKKGIYMVFGGFHLAGFNDEEIKEIIKNFRAQGVKKVGPCHCSGNEARRLFATEYKDNYIKIGVGKEIRVQ